MKKVKTRDPELDDLLENKIRPNFKFHEFRSRKNLYDTVISNLQERLLALLKSGLEQHKRRKQEAINANRIDKKQISKAVVEKQQGVPENMIKNAKNAYGIGDYLSAIVHSSTAVEVSLRLALGRRGISEKELKEPFVKMLEHASKMQLLKTQDRSQLRELRHVRNATIHEARIPTKATVLWAVDIATKIVRELAKT